MKSYKHIFFDLDRTLWDFDANASETLAQIVNVFHLEDKVINIDEFILYFHLYNDKLWDDYRAGKIRKQSLRLERFCLLFHHFKIADKDLIQSVSKYYLNAAPAKTNLIEGTNDILPYLAERYRLYIISNGFYDVQLTKVINSGISKYIAKIFTSDRIGHAKPDKRIFEYAVTSINSRKADCLMVGDDIKNDIIGSQNASIDQVYFNPGGNEHDSNPTYEIKNLLELKEIL